MTFQPSATGTKFENLAPSVEDTQTCPICNGTSARQEGGLYDDRYGYPGMYALRRCSSCGHEFLVASFTPEELARLYTDYYPRRDLDPEEYQPDRPISAWRGFWTGARSSAFRWVPENVSVLDIGCGFGQALGYHRDRGCRVAGVEADENARKIAQRQKLDIRIGVFTKEMFKGETFDYVTLDQVIEHVQDPCRLLADIRSVLKKDGCVVIATPRSRGLGRFLLGTRWVHWHSPYHLQFFTPRSMQELASRNGFTVVSQHAVTTSEWLHYQWIHLVTRPPPREPSLFWTHRVVPPRLKKWLRPLYVLHLIGINHLLGRILDSLRLGDNQVYLLRVSHD